MRLYAETLNFNLTLNLLLYTLNFKLRTLNSEL